MQHTNIRIIQTSLPGTGSTFVANLIAGLICPDEPIAFPTKKMIGRSLLTKSHSQEPLTLFSDHAEYDIYMVVTSRPVRKQYPQDVLDHPRVLNIDYDEILVTQERDLKTTVSALVDRILSFLPPSILPDKPVTALRDQALARIVAMNRVVEDLADEPFSVRDPFFHIHGSHRDRARKRWRRIWRSNIVPRLWGRMRRAQK